MKKITSKTKSQLDDILVNVMEQPVVVLLIVFGFSIGLGRLDFNESITALIKNAVNASFTITVTWIMVRLIDALLRNILEPLAQKTETDFDNHIIPVIRKLLKIGIWCLGIVVALNNAGFNVGALIAGLGIGGLALAMAAKDTVSNFFGGFTVFADKPFKFNDRVRIGGYDGFIREVGIRSTRLQTLDGTMVTIPNAKFIDTFVENVSLEPSRKVVLNLGLTYNTTPEKMQLALDVLGDITANCDMIEENVIKGFNAFNDFSLNIILIYFIKKESDIIGTQNFINLEILKRFNAEGLEFAFPTQTIYTKSEA